MNEFINTDTVPVSGEVLIQKFDINGNKTFEEGGKNAIKSLVGFHAKRAWRSAFSAWCPNQPRELAWDSYDPKNMCRWMYLVLESDAYDSVFPAPSVINEDSSPVFPMMNRAKSYIGYVQRHNQTIGSDTKVGVINYQESYCTKDKAVFVYDFSTANAVGSFDTIVHADTDSPNDLTIQERHRYETVLVNGRVFSPIGAYCFYDDGFAGDIPKYIVHNPRAGGVGYETQLHLTRTEISTGANTTIVLPNKYEDVNGITCYRDNNKTLFFVKNTNGLSLFLDQGNTGTFVLVNTPAWNSWVWGNYGISVDANYVYIGNTSDSIWRRWNHTTPSVQTLNTIDVGGSYNLAKIGNKYYDSNNSCYYDIPGEWNGQTLIRKTHKYGYPNFAEAYGETYGEYVYINATHYGWQTSPSSDYNQASWTCLARCKLTAYKQCESVHYKHGSIISKSNSETMKITYTFNFS